MGYNLSILIPSYQKPDYTLKAVTLALGVPALEIVVSDDASDYDIEVVLTDFCDERLVIYKQPRSLGLWENHLFLLNHAKGEWVYFLQTDDSFHNELFFVLNHEDLFDVGIIHSDPLYLNLEQHSVKKSKQSVLPGRYDSDRFMRILRTRGNLLGRPSYNIYRRSLLPTDQLVWRTNVSADLVVNTIVSSKGDVLITQPYLTGCGIHSEQDGRKQSLSLAYDRLVNAARLLSMYSESTKRFAITFFKVEFIFFCYYWCKNRLKGDSDVLRSPEQFFRCPQVFNLLSGFELIAPIKYFIFKLKRYK